MHNWEVRFYLPALCFVVGLIQYLYRKYWDPVPEKTIKEINAISFFGMAGENFSPRDGKWLMFTGILMFIVINTLAYIMPSPSFEHMRGIEKIQNGISVKENGK